MSQLDNVSVVPEPLPGIGRRFIAIPFQNTSSIQEGLVSFQENIYRDEDETVQLLDVMRYLDSDFVERSIREDVFVAMDLRDCFGNTFLNNRNSQDTNIRLLGLLHTGMRFRVPLTSGSFLLRKHQLFFFCDSIN